MGANQWYSTTGWLRYSLNLLNIDFMFEMSILPLTYHRLYKCGLDGPGDDTAEMRLSNLANFAALTVQSG